MLHPRTMRPLARRGIPLQIKNTLRPDAPGTEIGPAEPGGAPSIRAVTAIRGAALVRVEGAAALEVPDLARRVFGPLAEAGVPVYLVAQASAEGSLGVAVREADAEASAALLRRALEREIERGDVVGVTVAAGRAVIAAVGSGLSTQPGMAGRFFDTLAHARVNVSAAAQGGGDHTVSALVADDDATAAVRALHEAFSRGRLHAHVVVVGAGTLGRRVLGLLAERSGPLLEAGIRLTLVGVADSRRLVWDPAGAGDALSRLEGAPVLEDVLEALTERVTTARLERVVVVDATASAEVAARHAEWLGSGAAVVTPNKAATGPTLDTWRRAHAASRAGRAPYLYDAAVGAGLGIMGRLRDLVRTGDRVHEIEAVLSGTLSFVMSRMRAGDPFSAAVRAARDAGLTEPDARDDLSGRDVARKLVLLAHEVGLAADALEVESLVPPALEDVPLAAFWERLPEADDAWRRRLEGGGEVQYVARVGADGAVRAGVEPVEPGSLLAALGASEIAVAVRTERSAEHPVFFQGPGANVEVTSSVVLADVVRAAEGIR